MVCRVVTIQAAVISKVQTLASLDILFHRNVKTSLPVIYPNIRCREILNFKFSVKMQIDLGLFTLNHAENILFVFNPCGQPISGDLKFLGCAVSVKKDKNFFWQFEYGQT